MIGLLLIVLLFALNITIIAIERKSRCWYERKFWISVFFLLFLLALSVYGYSSVPSFMGDNSASGGRFYFVAELKL